MNLHLNPLSYLGAFLGGLAVSFSPCVYPLIPVTLGFIGVKAGSSRARGLRISLVYVLGLAITYSILGLVAALSGRLFGEIASSPIPFIVISLACFIAGLSFFDLVRIRLPGIQLGNKIKISGGPLPVFLLGMVSGLVVGPCATPVLGTILVYVAARQNLFYGASLLFVFAYGAGFSLILVGTFGSLFVSLNKSGIWLMRIKRVSGAILLIMAGYFLFKAGTLIW